MAYHDQLKRRALQAAKALHADTSVSQETTLDSLEELYEEVEMLICAVQEDITRQGGVLPEYAEDGPDPHSDYREP